MLKRVFVIGAIGFGQMGNECFLQQIINIVRHDDPGIHIGVLSDQPQQTAKLGVEAVPRCDMKAMWEALVDSDTVIWFETEHHKGWRVQGLELLLVRLAQWQKKSVHAYRPFTDGSPSGWLDHQARRIFKRCEKRFAYGLGDETTEDMMPSPLLFVQQATHEGLRRLQDENITLSRPPIALCIDRETTFAHLDKIATFVDALIDDAGAPLLFMPVDHFADMEGVNRLLDEMKRAAPVMRKSYAAQEWMDILGSMHAVITTYASVEAMCKGLNVPCTRLSEEVVEYLLDGRNIRRFFLRQGSIYK